MNSETKRVSKVLMQRVVRKTVQTVMHQFPGLKRYSCQKESKFVGSRQVLKNISTKIKKQADQDSERSTRGGPGKARTRHGHGTYNSLVFAPMQHHLASQLTKHIRYRFDCISTVLQVYPKNLISECHFIYDL